MAGIELPSNCSWTDALSLFEKYFADNRSLSYFCKCKNNLQRIEFIISQPDIKNFLLHWLERTRKQKNKKCHKVSSCLRKEGNDFFKKKFNKLALKKYTQAIFFAPEDGESLPVAYANRSAVLYDMKKYDECIKDIKHAFTYSYPKKFHYKLFHRKGQALLKLNQLQESAECLQKSLDMLAFAEITPLRKSELKRDITTLLNSLEENSSSLIMDEESKIPILETENSCIPYASAALSLQYEESRGRFLLANQYIKEGTTLFFEKPFACILLPEFNLSHCHHCCSSSSTLIPCKYCCEAGFCSLFCYEKAWIAYHQHECPNMDILNIIGIAHLSLRTIFAAGVEHVYKLKDSLDKKKHPSGIPGLNELGKLEDSYYSVYHLVAHTEKLNQSDLLYHSLTAFLILLLFDDENGKVKQSLESMSSSEAIPHHHRSFIGSLLMHHMQQLICNAHAITDIVSPDDDENNKTMALEQVRIATGIFPSASLMNHSCNPNIISSFYKSSLIVRSTKCIPSGCEIFNCYGPHYRRMNVGDRKSSLLQQYFFLCRCEACENESKTHNGNIELFCSGCSDSFYIDPNKRITSAKCSKCGLMNEFTDYLKKYESANLYYSRALHDIESKQYKDAINKLKECLTIRKAILPVIHNDIATVKDKLAFVYSQRGEFFKAYEMLKESIASVKIRYGSESIEVAHELRKLSDVIINLLVDPRQLAAVGKIDHFESFLSEALDAVEGSRRIFHTFYGDWHEDTREMVDLLKQLRGFERSETQEGQ